MPKVQLTLSPFNIQFLAGLFFGQTVAPDTPSEDYVDLINNIEELRKHMTTVELEQFEKEIAAFKRMIAEQGIEIVEPLADYLRQFAREAKKYEE